MSTYVIKLTRNITKGSSTEKICNSNTYKGDITCAEIILNVEIRDVTYANTKERVKSSKIS